MRGFLAKLLKFIPVAVVFYLLVMALLANTASPLLFDGQPYTDVPLNQPEGGLSALRYREAETAGPVDVVFFGSSHCYRTFDTAWLAGKGLRTFNLGSTSQTPVNTYFLAREFLKKLKPRLVVLEVYSETLRSGGEESLLDLLANRPLDFNLVRMTAAVGGVKSWNNLLVNLLNWSKGPVAARQPAYKPGNGHYVPGGFVSRDSLSGGIGLFPGPSIPIKTKQLDYLERVIKLVLDQDRKIVLVAQPLPRKTLKGIADYHHVQSAVAQIAGKYGVPFYDFNGLVPERQEVDLHAPDLFFDYHHFNKRGTSLFNPIFLDLLQRDHWLPANLPPVLPGSHQ